MFPEDHKKLPFRGDQVLNFKRAGIDKITREILLDPILFVENLLNNSMIHKPPANIDFLQKLLNHEDNMKQVG